MLASDLIETRVQQFAFYDFQQKSFLLTSHMPYISHEFTLLCIIFLIC